jgi:Uma2 family endonuclease
VADLNPDQPDLVRTPADQPGHVRRPDPILVDTGAVDRAEDEHRLIRADGVSLVVEIISAGPRRKDRPVRRDEYAEAGTGHHWIIDLDALR